MHSEKPAETRGICELPTGVRQGASRTARQLRSTRNGQLSSCAVWASAQLSVLVGAECLRCFSDPGSANNTPKSIGCRLTPLQRALCRPYAADSLIWVTGPTAGHDSPIVGKLMQECTFAEKEKW